MEFFNNVENEKLNFKIDIEGVDTETIELRLLLLNKKRNCLFFGKLNKDMCSFEIPELSCYSKEDEGIVKFEIISNDLYFLVWEDEFSIKSKVVISAEKLDDAIKEIAKSKPKINAKLDVVKEEPKKTIKIEKEDEKDDDEKDDEKTNESHINEYLENMIKKTSDIDNILHERFTEIPKQSEKRPPLRNVKKFGEE